MPRRTDIKTILIIGAGPIVIGQGCEFDYSGTQACKALKAEGYRVILVNSNPATIMTDPETADRTYIEPVTPESVEKILIAQAQRGDPVHAVLPTLGGQTALNVGCKLWDDGVLQRLGVELIGASRQVIHRAEDREQFRRVCQGLGLALPPSKTVTTLADAEEFLAHIGLPAVIRPAFTLGGTGGGIAYNLDEYRDIVLRGLRASMIGQVQIDKSLIGWKEYELEVVRDRKDNCVVVCGIENIDAMGVHTGDSITVAPIQTLSDKEYQALRDAAIAIMRAVGVETGGSNVQFAVNPSPDPLPDGSLPFEMVVVEMNPRVSRSSALASKATGFPIAKVAAKLAVGYTLDELRNDITGTTSACFEPSIDYVVTKVPRWTFEKFPEADETLTTQMKSVGEAMAIGRTFCESLQKALRSTEVKRFGLGLDRNDKWLLARRAAAAGPAQPAPQPPRTADGEAPEWPIADDKLRRKLAVPSQGRIYYVRYAMKMGMDDPTIAQLTRYDPWFVAQLRRLVSFEDTLLEHPTLESLPRQALLEAKRLGYSDAQLAFLYLGSLGPEAVLRVRQRRKALGVTPVFKLVDTCAAEFQALTPYYYSTYEHPFTLLSDAGAPAQVTDDEARLTDRPKVVIIGGGPNRIGQGIEFDYCCCHAAFAAREMGLESVMINSNPETVSTDYDTSDLLFFEPLTLEDVLNVVERLNGAPLTPRPDEHPSAGAPSHSGLVRGLIVQFGGQTPLNLARGLQLAGAPIIGTSVDSIDMAEDRDRFDALLGRLGLQKPPSGIARTVEQAALIAARIGYPVLVRPSYVLGGRGMEICSDDKALASYMAAAALSSDLDDAPVLIDRFLSDATEVDVDVVADFGPPPHATHPPSAVICSIMEHIEEAGIHSGDSSCTIPPWSLRQALIERIGRIARELARELRVRGLMNLQLAIKNGEIYVLEVNPRASRTVPFVSKAVHVPWPRIAAKVMMGASLAQLGAREVVPRASHAVKVSVFPFSKFPGVDVALGPEMRSTGEVMGIDQSWPIAFAKGLLSAGLRLPLSGAVFLSVRQADKETGLTIARSLWEMGFSILATAGTAAVLRRAAVPVAEVPKVNAYTRPNVIDLMTDGKVQLVINTPTRTGWNTDEGKIRAATVRLGIPMITTATGAMAAVQAIAALRQGDWAVAALQDHAAAERAALGTQAGLAPSDPPVPPAQSLAPHPPHPPRAARV
ncbi:MAG: carbamoyl phosphate synthase large subunit [Isosphaera sp.]|nr:carbamoyl phosphate synthase large subunit [Isosphaera sp.]